MKETSNKSQNKSVMTLNRYSPANCISFKVKFTLFCAQKGTNILIFIETLPKTLHSCASIECVRYTVLMKLKFCPFINITQTLTLINCFDCSSIVQTIVA